MPDDAPRHRLIERLEDRRTRHRERSKIVRALTVIVGATLLLGGIAMLVLPGPALAVIPVGLAVLALEFTWAENALERALDRAEKASAAAREASRVQKLLSAIAMLLALGAFAAWAAFGDVPLLPV